MKILDVKQGSPEWQAARLGIPTASEMDALVSPLGKVREGAGADTYLYRKLCEKIMGCRLNDVETFAMKQGAIMELEAGPWYQFEFNRKIDRVGICLTDDGRAGASPDGLIGEDGGIEIKCFQPEHALRTLMEGVVPAEYVVQVQMCLWVTGRAWWDFISYSRQFPALVVRVTPDPKLQGAIKTALTQFYARFDAALAKIEGMTNAENAIKQAAYEADLKKQGII